MRTPTGVNEGSTSGRLLAALKTPMSTMEIAVALGEKPGHVSGLVWSLERRGLIARTGAQYRSRGRPSVIWRRLRDAEAEQAKAIGAAADLLERAGWLVRAPRRL